MPFRTCIPCFRDKEKRHSTEEDLKPSAPVENIVNNNTTSAARPIRTDTKTSKTVTFSSDKEPEQSTNVDQKVTEGNEKPNETDTKQAQNKVSFDDDQQSEYNTPLSSRFDVSSQEDRDTNPGNLRPIELDSHGPDTSPNMADSLKSATSGVTNTVSSGAQQAQSTVSSGAQQAQSAASSGAEKVQGGASSATTGGEDWHAMTEDQKKATYDALPAEKKQNMGYYDWVKQGLYNQKENWMPWIEDQYLRWFTRDNKASYATKDAMDKTKVTNIEQVDKLQDSVNSTVSGQVGQGGLLQPIGDMAGKEGINRAERGGKDDSGSYAGGVGGKDASGGYLSSAGGAVSSAGGSLLSGAKSAGGYVGGMFGGKKEGETK